jgi:hypothetical protein
MLFSSAILLVNHRSLLATIHTYRPQTTLALVLNHDHAEVALTYLARLGEASSFLQDEGFVDFGFFAWHQRRMGAIGHYIMTRKAIG